MTSCVGLKRSPNVRVIADETCPLAASEDIRAGSPFVGVDVPMERAIHDRQMRSGPGPKPTTRRVGAFGRLVSAATSGVDRVMLNGVRTMLNLTVPRFAPDELAAELDRIEIFTSDETLADSERLLAAPREPMRFNLAKERKLRGRHPGTFRHLRARTPYTPVHPEYETEWASYDRLSTVHLYAWQHDRPARASILLAHGWGAGQRKVHEIEFGVRSLYRELGLDVYFYVTPFHGRRRPSAARVSGELFPSPDLIRTNEGFIQTVRELRGCITTILDHNPAPLGMMGSSLGGYTTALLASVDPRLSYAIPVLPMASLADLFWHHAGRGLRNKLTRMGLTRDRFEAAWALHSPLSWTPKMAPECRMIVSAVGDALVPAEQTEKLVAHWGRPYHYRFAGSHLLQVGARDYHREIGRFLRTAHVI